MPIKPNYAFMTFESERSVSSKKLDCFVSIDFDGTITDSDITDAVIKKFARPEWEAVERLWEAGAIGSMECLSKQMALIDASLAEILEYAGEFSVNETFSAFVNFLRKNEMPFAIISDGFDLIIKKILSKSGLSNIPVYSNRITEIYGELMTSFPYNKTGCSSGVCKCSVARANSGGLPVIHIGDGRSDFCLAEDAAHVFSKKKLTDYCRTKNLNHTPFFDFKTIENSLAVLIERGSFESVETEKIMPSFNSGALIL
ncbi:MAG: MtnX-like HAD-IB family phosphatase [Nitrospirae bacterium]|nr:MtnX-like HAD-IB family phosphatase [Nitrospirota bacterium]